MNLRSSLFPFEIRSIFWIQTVNIHKVQYLGFSPQIRTRHLEFSDLLTLLRGKL